MECMFKDEGEIKKFFLCKKSEKSEMTLKGFTDCDFFATMNRTLYTDGLREIQISYPSDNIHNVTLKCDKISVENKSNDVIRLLYINASLYGNETSEIIKKKLKAYLFKNLNSNFELRYIDHYDVEAVKNCDALLISSIIPYSNAASIWVIGKGWLPSLFCVLELDKKEVGKNANSN